MSRSNRLHSRWLVAGVGMVLLLGHVRGHGQEASRVSFKQDVQPIFNARCVVCHVAGAESGELNLQRSVAYENLVGVDSVQAPLARVSAGAPSKSYLMHKLRGTQALAEGSGVAMPFSDGSAIPLPAAEIELIERWIEQGAEKN